MTHIVAGYPNLNESHRIAHTMIDSNVDLLEIQIPFSDPIADGKTILKANTEALKNSITPDACFRLLKKLKKQTNIPILFMTYFNIPFNFGLEKFIKKAKNCGCYGLIIPDIPIDEEKSEHYLSLCKKYCIHPIQVISPLTPERRLKKIAKAAKGFIYCVSTTGTTGERKKLQKNLKNYTAKIRKFSKLPLALGFGISDKIQAEKASKYADIIVIGSKIINIYDQSPKNQKLPTIKKFLKSILK